MIGQKVGGRYQIVQQLRQGGFGTTSLAEDTQRPGNPKCVVKKFRPLSNDGTTMREAKRLFDLEAETMEMLGNHDQIPRLLAHFEDNGEFYLVQEYIEGHDLTKDLPPFARNYSEAEVIELLIQILEVLSFVHKSGVIHRDIKPSNIRRRKDGKIVLIDFGAVKQIRGIQVSSEGETSFTIAVGTPGYMSSEQGAGTPYFSSDIYSVGVIGIQALVGLFPDPKQGSKLPKSQQTGEILWRTSDQYNSALAEILDIMVRYDFRQRYPNVEAVLAELKKISPNHFYTIQNHPESPTISNSINLSSTAIQGQINSPTHPPHIPVYARQWKALIGLIIAAVIGAFIAFWRPFANQQEWETYVNSNLNIKIQYPLDWQRQDLPYPGLTQEVVTFLSQQAANQGNFQENITISVIDYSGTLSDSKDTFINEIKKGITGANVIESGSSTLANRPAIQVIYTGNDANHELKNLKIWTLSGDKAYVITYTADAKDYNRFLSIANSMIKSFEMKE